MYTASLRAGSKDKIMLETAPGSHLNHVLNLSARKLHCKFPTILLLEQYQYYLLYPLVTRSCSALYLDVHDLSDLSAWANHYPIT